MSYDILLSKSELDALYEGLELEKMLSDDLWIYLKLDVSNKVNKMKEELCICGCSKSRHLEYGFCETDFCDCKVYTSNKVNK